MIWVTLVGLNTNIVKRQQRGMMSVSNNEPVGGLNHFLGHSIILKWDDSNWQIMWGPVLD